MVKENVTNGAGVEPPENGNLKSLDDVIAYVNQSINELKKLIKPSAEKPVKIDDFKLLKEQQDTNLDKANQRIGELESQFNELAEGFKNKSPSRTNLEAVWDFLFKP